MAVPGRGELVGRAYIEMLIDSKRLDGEIKKLLKAQAEKFEAAGTEHGDRYNKGIKRALRKGDYADAARQVLAKNDKAIKRVAQSQGQDYVGELKRSIAKSAKDIRIAEIFDADMKRATAEGTLDFKRFADEVRTRMVAATREYNKELERSNRLQDEMGRRLDENMRRVGEDGRRQIALQRDLAQAAEDAGKRLDSHMAWVGRQGRVLTALQRQNDAWSTYASNVGRSLPVLTRRMDQVNDRLKSFTRIAQQVGISNPFPRSRWLRPLGGIISLVSKMPGMLLDLGQKAFEAGAKIFQAFAQDGLVGGLKAMLPLLTGGVAGFVALAAAGTLLIIVIGPLAALISGLVGALVALTGSVVLGLIGAVGAALPLVLALGAAAGVLAIAFTGNKDALKESVQPLKDWAKALRQPIQDAVFPAIIDGLARMRPLLDALTPLMLSSADAIARMFSSLATSFSSDGFIANFAPLSDPSTGIPALIDKLGSSLGHLTAGAFGFLTALLPTSQKLADNILSISTRFDNFANSASGKVKIAAFFDKAWESATRLGGVIRAAWKVLAETFNSGQSTGDSFLTSIISSLDRFAKFVKNGGLIQWFKDAKQTMKDLGPVMDALGGFFKSLVTPESIKNLGAFLKFLTSLIHWVIVGIGWLDKIGRATALFFKAMDPGNWVDGISKIDWGSVGSEIVNGIKAGLGWVWDGLKGWFKGLWDDLVNSVKNWLGIHSPSTVFSEIGGFIVEGLKIGLSLLGGVLLDLFGKAFKWAGDAVIAWFTGTFLPWVIGLPGQIGGALASLALDLLGWIGGAFITAGQAALDWFTGTFLPWATGLPGQVGSALLDLGQKFLDLITEPFKTAWNGVSSWWSETALPFLTGIPEQISKGVTGLGDTLYNVFIQPFENLYTSVAEVINKLIEAYNSIPLAPDLPLLSVPSSERSSGARGGNMRGGWVTQPGWYGGAPIGERYLKEIVVPMELPMSQVNPNIRWAAELLRNGSKPKGNMAGGYTGGGGVTVAEGAIQISGVDDAWTAAHLALDGLVGGLRLG